MGLICCACCCNNLLSKSLEIVLIVFHSIGFVFLLLCLILIHWNKMPKANLAFFILMLLISLSNLILIIFIRYWRAKNLIKTSKKQKGITLSTIGLVFIIILFIICFIEEFVLSYGIKKANYPCYSTNSVYTNNYYYLKKKVNSTIIENENKRILDDKDIICSLLGSNYYTGAIKNGEILLAYFTFSFLEVCLIWGMFIWFYLRRRIIQGLDGPLPIVNSVLPMRQGGVYDQYGRQVVVVQPGDVVVMDGQRHVAVSSQDQINNQYNNQ